MTNDSRVNGSVYTIRVVSLAGGSGPILGVQLNRASGERFDSTDYDNASINRGWLTVFYED